MLLENYFTSPTSLIETLIYVVAALGAILITYGVFLEPEKRQDLIIFTGAGCLFVYALYIHNLIFMIATAGLGLAALVEFIEIYFGLFKYGKNDLKKYKTMK